MERSKVAEGVTWIQRRKEARKRKVEKKEKEEKKNKDGKNQKVEEGIRSSQKVAFGRQNPYKGEIARRLRMKKKKRIGKKATKWQDNGKRSNIWTT